MYINLLTSNDIYNSHTAKLTSKYFILYIYSTNRGTEYFKYALYTPFISLQNAVCFIRLICLVPILFTFYLQGVLKLKKKIVQESLMYFFRKINNMHQCANKQSAVSV